MHWFSTAVGIGIFCPAFIFFGSLWWSKQRHKKPAIAIGRASDWTTLFLLGAVYLLAEWAFGPLAWIVVCVPIASSIIYIAIREKKSSKEFRLWRSIRKVWRFLFIYLTLCYLFFFSWNLVETIRNQM